ncbi:SAF domain-containing protein [Paenibacillus sp. 11B]|uniref:SAF domain-containing protein n=1 Tax=Paenibacillus sp. 11B TaxID=3060965 RepID=UPI00264CE522|nr:SAF domain-containing protein [Paenibacillus sp. 11B]MDN8593246.1 SAF domain-containing protein [Paenibacillus sp. 11B]
MSKIRFRQKQLLLAGGIGALSVLLLCSIFGVLYVNHLTDKYTEKRLSVEQELAQTQQVLKEDMIKVEVVTRNISSGEPIQESDLETRLMPRNAVSEEMVLSKELIRGKVAKVELPTNTPVTSTVIYEDEITSRDLRSQEFRLMELPSKLQKSDYVDVRIKFPSGQDYIILSKKRVEDLIDGTVWYHMNEKEILNISGAIVDAYIQDATIYALSYVEPGIQEKAITTYPANKAVQDLIDSDPNIVQKATTELERRNRIKLEEAMNAMTPEQKQEYKNKLNTQQIAENQAKSAQPTTQQQSTNDLITEAESTPQVDTEMIFNDQNSVGAETP